MHTIILIVGASIIVMTIAYEIKKREPKALIAIVEKEENAAMYSSGCNIGVLHTEFYYTANSSKVFIRKAKDMVKSIGNKFKPILVGIRAQLRNTKTNELVQDFVVEHGRNSTHGLNVISPAFTCNFAFAKHVVYKINQNKKGE